MGRLNAELIRICERARKQHGTQSPHFKKAEKAVIQSQIDCLHDGEHRWMRVDKPSLTGKYQAGQRIEVCMECSKILE